jgi:hypothetical protein
MHIILTCIKEQLLIKATFSDSLEWPLYTDLHVLLTLNIGFWFKQINRNLYIVGHHNASYTVIKTPEGIQFKKLRHSEPIPNAKGIHQKVKIKMSHKIFISRKYPDLQYIMSVEETWVPRAWDSVNCA